MARGQLRAEPNISLRRAGSEELGVKTELKNINSFRALHRAIDHEVRRQTELLESGGVVVQVDNRHQDSLEPGDGFPPPPRDRIDGLRRAYLGEDRRAGRTIRNIEHVQPFVLTSQELPKYDVKYLGREQIDDLCTPDFTDHDAIRSHAQSLSDQLPERDSPRPFDIGRPRHQSHHVGVRWP